MERRKEKVALSSVFASLFLTLSKLIVGILTGSIGIISEALHSALDFAAAFITYLSVRISGKPADITHHYGHGKVESLSALIETFLLFATSIWIIYEALHRLAAPSVEVEATWYAFAIMIISIIIDITRSRALLKVARETNSQALEADALHFSSDIYSSAVVLVGLILIKFDVKNADSFAAIGVALLVIFAGVRLGKRTIDVLIDKAPFELTEKVKKIVAKADGVVSVDRVRIRPTGPSYHVEIAISISRTLSLEQVSKITKTIEENIFREVLDADIVIHTNPVALKGETIIERIQTIAFNHNLSAHDIRVYTLDNKKYVDLDLEVNENYNLEKAHKVSSRIEESIKAELGPLTNVNIHIEPTKHKEEMCKELKSKKTEEINKIINSAKNRFPEIKEIHDITIHNLNNKISISMHCVLSNRTSLEKAHKISELLKGKIENELPNVEKVLVHTEPFRR